MKQNKIGTKCLILMIAIILIVGAILVFTKGLEYELKYQDCQKVELNIGKEYEEKDIKEITDEIFKNQSVSIQSIEVYKDAFSITTTKITEEQKTELVSKINEKYETELNAEDVKIEDIAHTRGRDIVRPYIIPFTVATAIILVYVLIRYHKLNSFEVLTETIGIFVLSQLVLLGIMAITGMPVGRFTLPAIIFVYMISTYICTTIFEEKLEVKKQLEKNK